MWLRTVRIPGQLQSAHRRLLLLHSTSRHSTGRLTPLTQPRLLCADSLTAMERICGGEWSGSLVHDGDLLPCIQALIVRIPPPLLLMVPAAAWRLWTLRQRPPLVERKLLEPRLAFLCVSLQLLLALLAFVFSLATSPRPYEVFEGLATLAGWSASLSVLYRERRCQLRLHPASRIYWAIDFLTSTKAIETAIWSMAHGNELDDSMLLSMLRWPIAAVLLYFSLAWRSRGFDDNAEPEMTSVGAAQGGLRSLRSPREYVVVDRDEEEAWGGGDTASRPEHPQGLWGRFMQFALPDDESIEKVDMSLKGVNHVDSGSFLRIDSPLPRPLPLGLAPPHAHEALRVPRARDPSTHPLYDAEVLVPSVTESTVRHRSVVQFCVSVRVRSPTFASGDQSIDTITVWKKAREFEGLHDMLQLTASKYDTVSVPDFPQYSPAHPERSRHNFESFLAALVSQNEPVLWNDLSDWVRLPEKLELMASHREFMRRRKSEVPAPGGGAVGAVMALLGSSPPSSTVAASAAPVAPAPSSSLPKSSSSGGSAAPYGWMLIGVSVSAWMRWMSSTAAAAAASPAPYSSRSSSSRRISIPAIDEEGEEETDSSAPAPATYVTFDIRVRSSLGEWHVHKKLSEMQTLRAEVGSRRKLLHNCCSSLVNRFPGIPVPQLSVDGDWDRDESSLGQARRVLEVFLQSVVGTSFFECAELYSCLAEQSHPLRRVTDDRMVACSDPTLLPQQPPQPDAPVVLPAFGSALSAPPQPQQQHPRSDSMAIAAPRKGRAEKSSTGGGVGSLPSSSPLSSSLLSQSISAAEDYFAADNANANGVASSFSPSAGDVPSALAAPSPRHTQAQNRLGRTSSSSRRGITPSAPAHHFASSYLDAGDSFLANSNSASSGNDDDDEAVSDSDDGAATADDDAAQTAQSVVEQQSSGVLPSVGGSAGGRDRPTGNHRFAVFVPSWSFARGGGGGEDDAPIGSPASASGSLGSTPSSKSGSQQQHVVFTVVIREFFDLTTYLEWSVTRRFQQFDRLHRALKAQFPSLALPELPPKTMFGKKQNKAFLDARQRQLELYVQQLINNTTFQVDEFFSFFDMNKSDRAITMGNLAAPTADRQ